MKNDEFRSPVLTSAVRNSIFDIQYFCTGCCRYTAKNAFSSICQTDTASPAGPADIPMYPAVPDIDSVRTFAFTRTAHSASEQTDRLITRLQHLLVRGSPRLHHTPAPLVHALDPGIKAKSSIGAPLPSADHPSRIRLSHRSNMSLIGNSNYA
jgi:hypothetical protein